jgi:hypothetical protein
VKASLPVEALSGWVRISLPKLQTLCPLVPYWLSCRSVLAAFWSLVESASTMVLFMLMLWIPSVWVRLSPQMLRLQL